MTTEKHDPFSQKNGIRAIQNGGFLSRIALLITHQSSAVIHRGVETFGCAETSLVKGMILLLSALGASIKQGGPIDELGIHGGLNTRGPNVFPLELEGAITSLTIKVV